MEGHILTFSLSLSPPLQDNGKLYMNLLELEASGDPRSAAGAVQECVTRALAAPLSPRTKMAFSQRGMQYAEDYGTSIQRSDAPTPLLRAG